VNSQEAKIANDFRRFRAHRVRARRSRRRLDHSRPPAKRRLRAVLEALECRIHFRRNRHLVLEHQATVSTRIASNDSGRGHQRALTPAAGQPFENPRGCEDNSVVRRSFARSVFAIRCSLDCSAIAPTAASLAACSSERDAVAKLQPALRQRARLVERKTMHAGQRSIRPAARGQNAHAEPSRPWPPSWRRGSGQHQGTRQATTSTASVGIQTRSPGMRRSQGRCPRHGPVRRGERFPTPTATPAQKILRQAIGDRCHVRLVLPGLGDHVNDLPERCLVAHALDRDLEGARTGSSCPRIRRRRAPCRWGRLSPRQSALSNRAASRGHRAVHGDTLAGRTRTTSPTFTWSAGTSTVCSPRRT